MTKGDRDKLRAEMAGRCMDALISLNNNDLPSQVDGNPLFKSNARLMAVLAVKYADALMAELGIKGEDQGYYRRDYPYGMDG